MGCGHHPASRRAEHRLPHLQAARYTFPITTGRVDAKTTAGFIKHSGGLLLARFDAGAWTALNLTKFTINITGAPNLTAIVNGGPAC